MIKIFLKRQKFSVLFLMISVLLTFQDTISASSDLSAVDLGDIRVEGEIGRRIDGMLRQNILKVDIEKDFLLPFVTGKQEARNYVGIGKLIDALVLYEQYIPNAPEVRVLKNHILQTLTDSQDEDGYIGYFSVPIPERICSKWSTHELSYIIQGFASDYLAFKKENSLKTAAKAADFLMKNWPARACPEAAWYKTEFIGFPTAILRLYEATGERKYIDFVNQTLAVPQWNPDLENRDISQPNHSYTHLSHCLEQLYLYQISGDLNLLKATDEIIDFLTHSDGMLVTGGISQNELWHNTQECCGNFAESCAIAYLLRLLHHRFLIQPKAIYGDIAERILYNALIAAQSPDCRRLRYHTPAEGPRDYYKFDYYCCPNNLRRIMPEISAMIYYSANGEPGLIVNQYVSSQGRISLSDGNIVTLRQISDYPHGDDVRIYIDSVKKSKFPIRLRMPGWCSDTDVMITINENPACSVRGGDFYEMNRIWKSGDAIRIKFPVRWRIVEGRKWQSGTCAILRGPVVYCLNPDHNPDLKNISPQLYHRIVINPDTLKVAESKIIDGVVYHAGIVEGWRPGSIQNRSLDLVEKTAKTNLNLILTEFADPGGVRTFFLIKPGADRMQDELIR